LNCSESKFLSVNRVFSVVSIVSLLKSLCFRLVLGFPSCIDSDFYNVAWANSKLRFAIANLQGKYEKSIWKRRLQTALIVKDELLEHGYRWQAEKIDFWIHRLEKKEKAKDKARLEKQERAKSRFTAAPAADLREREEEASF